MASWFNKVLFKLHGAQKWPWADATVFDCTVGEPGRYGNRRVEVSYSFWIESHIYSGIAVWNDSNAPTAYSKNDVIQIQYNPSDPNESYFPEQEETQYHLFPHSIRYSSRTGRVHMDWNKSVPYLSFLEVPETNPNH